MPTGATTFNYDLNGNRTSSTSPLSSTSLTWQSTSGRLVCVNTAGTSCSTSSPSATTSLYSYDGEGHRATSSTNGVTNSFIWDTGASQLLADSTHDYVYLQGSVTPDLQINLATGTVDLLIQDQNANTRGVVQIVGTNSTFDGTIVNYTDYDAYGNAITQSGGSINPGAMSNGGVSSDISTSFAFGAGYWDASNLTYLVHRYLDNETGQFISVDPLIDQTREAYVYAGDGPVQFLDAQGLSTTPGIANDGVPATGLSMYLSLTNPCNGQLPNHIVGTFKTQNYGGTGSHTSHLACWSVNHMFERNHPQGLMNWFMKKSPPFVAEGGTMPKNFWRDVWVSSIRSTLSSPNTKMPGTDPAKAVYRSSLHWGSPFNIFGVSFSPAIYFKFTVVFWRNNSSIVTAYFSKS